VVEVLTLLALSFSSSLLLLEVVLEVAQESLAQLLKVVAEPIQQEALARRCSAQNPIDMKKTRYWHLYRLLLPSSSTWASHRRKDHPTAAHLRLLPSHEMLGHCYSSLGLLSLAVLILLEAWEHRRGLEQEVHRQQVDRQRSLRCLQLWVPNDH
jgi:hypothetical protein